jgi:DNA-binding response OmpR family regulator
VHTKPQILIVDDEPAVCNVLTDDLSEHGYLCTTALDGREAVTKLEKGEFDIALLDIKMPGMSGLEVLKRIRADSHNTATIMITCVNGIDTVAAALKLGAWDYIIKPFDLDRVHTSICAALWFWQANAAAKGSAQMDAIASGVEAKHDLFSTISRIVTKRTVEIARDLGIAEEDIERWAEARQKVDSKRAILIKLALNQYR